MEIPKYTTDLHKKSGKVALDEEIKKQDKTGKEPLPTHKRKARCKKCSECIKDDCGKCVYMKIFGGLGK